MLRNVSMLCLGLVLGLFAPRMPNVDGHAATGYRFQQFSGSWGFHGGILHINQGGYGHLVFRTYQNCSNTVVTACDYFDQHSTIYDGGFTTFYLWKVQGNKTYGSVTNSSYSYQVGTTVTLVRNANDTLSINTVGPGGAMSACGSHAPAGYCGA